MLGEMVAEQAGHAIVKDTCTRAKKNGCNLLMQPPDKLQGALAVSTGLAQQRRCRQSITETDSSPVLRRRQQLLAGQLDIQMLQCLSCSN
jgi:flavoprotein